MVAGYGISITTLEEVFLAVGDGRDFKEHAFEKEKVRKKVLAAASGVHASETENEGDRQSLMTDKSISKAEYKKKKRDKKLEDYTIVD